jgi:hypothetical protein
VITIKKESIMANLVINGRVFKIKNIGTIEIEADKKDRADLFKFANATVTLQIAIYSGDSAINMPLINRDDDVAYIDILVK